MEILTLLKANIKRKKGSFISVVLLTLIIAMSVAVVLSLKESALKGVDRIHELCDTPDLLCFYNAHSFSEDNFRKAEDSELVKSAAAVDFIIADSVKLGENENRNITMIYKADENMKTINEDLKSIETDPPKLKKGEMYAPQGLLTNINGKVGDTVTVKTAVGDFKFTVKGILLDPMMGAALIGWKSCCISEEDFAEIYSAVVSAETEDLYGLGKTLQIKMSDSCELSSVKFRRQLNLETGITDAAIGSLPKDMSVNYTTLFVTVCSSALIIFAILLLVIVVIVTVHSISVEIETEYVTFGVLKSQGFDKKKICLLFLEQYLMAEIIGAVLGIALSIPVVNASSNVFVTITAAPSVLSIP
ncbi:MAG: hypothetical protein NC228_10840, partial [[Eubacterium] siraeum]|nr:hypothetical protein [[Eubacterium] siraeum]